MVWCSHLLKNFPQFVVIHTVKGFGIVNKAEIDVFLELSCFFYDPMDVGNLISRGFIITNSNTGVGGGQGSLECCSPRGCKDSYTTE